MKRTKRAFEKHDILFWLGLPYAIIGGVFAVIGLTVAVLAQEWIFGLCFGGIGLIFLILGIIFLIVYAVAIVISLFIGQAALESWEIYFHV